MKLLSINSTLIPSRKPAQLHKDSLDFSKLAFQKEVISDVPHKVMPN